MAKAELELAVCDRLFHRVDVPIELVADCRPNEIGAIGIDAFLNQQIDMPQIDVSQINVIFSLSACAKRPFLVHLHHPHTIHMDGIWAHHIVVQEASVDLGDRD